MALRPIMAPMEELFSKLHDSSIPLNDQEFYELRLWDSADIWMPEFMVMQSRATWREGDRRFTWDESEVEQFPTLDKAKERYAARTLALTDRGFVICWPTETSWFPTR